ncbi:MAG TPA: acyl-CoA dehydrogenase family protein, partial [Solirubrobacteraceae bacterium]|nr:acyl-CoA dehydrogenase family protein [Solirubrobacteraceae bacterium]
AGDAELLIVAAMLDGEEGSPGGSGGPTPALFLVESKAAGIGVSAEPAMGVRAAATGTVTFQDVHLPAGALLGAGSPDVYEQCVALSRIGWCSLAVGCGRAVLDYVIPYVKDRIAFGEPISNRQGVAFTVSNIAIELDGMRLSTLRAAARADAGLPFAREATLARRLCAERGMQIGSDGVQMLGGHGYVKEHPVERWYRDLRAAGVMEGVLVV